MLPVEHGIGFIIIDEAFVQWIPMQWPWKAHGNVVDQAGRASAVTNFYWGNRLFSGGNTIQPVSMVLIAAVKIDFVCTNHRFDDFGVAGGKCFWLGTAGSLALAL